MNCLQETNESLRQLDDMLAILRASLEQVPWHRGLIGAERCLLRCKARLERDRERLAAERREKRRVKR